MITAEQCRAARGLLDWSQEDLAFTANVGIVTVRNLEAEKGKPRYSTLDVIQRAFESAGVLFLREDDSAGPGVRLRRTAEKKRLS